jgi:hypothetical protein
MADLQDWQPAVPPGQQLLAAAPVSYERPIPPTVRFLAFAVVYFLAFVVDPRIGPVPLAPIFLLALVGALVGWELWGQRQRRRRTGMAVAVQHPYVREPALLVTDGDILVTEMRTSWWSSRPTAQPIGPGRPVPGLVAMDAEKERLVLSFADGSRATLWPRQPKRGAAARVAALAAPVLERRRASGRSDETSQSTNQPA